jgi:hypothetical protein
MQSTFGTNYLVREKEHEEIHIQLRFANYSFQSNSDLPAFNNYPKHFF